jgi:sec-independent protein translocase protein TatB
MFDIGWGELLVIGVVALIAIGPKELPGALRTLGQWMGKLRRMASEFQGQFHEAMREAELHDLKKQVDEMTTQAQGYANFDPVSEVRKEFESTQQQIESAIQKPPETSSSATVPSSAAPTTDAPSSAVSSAEPAALPTPEVHAALPSPPAGEPATVGAEADSKHDSKPA